MRKRLIATCLMATFCLLVAHPAAAAPASRFSATISPEMELLAGVLTQTTWIKTHGPQGAGNEYFQALRDHFTPFKEHDAIKIAQEFTTRGFTYDAPVAFICHLGPLPDLKLQYEYSSYLINRVQGRDELEDFRAALVDLAQEADFLNFYQSWQPRFDEWLAAAEFDGDMVVGWLEQFFGQEASEFHLVLAPAMFPGGGYGAHVDAENGKRIPFQIIREQGTSTTSPVFPAGQDLEYLSLHEWGHSFVNPSLDAQPKEVHKLQPFFQPVASAMKKQAYPSVDVFMNEQVLRAVTTLASEELYGEKTYQAWLKKEEKRAFYLTKDIVAILRDYQNDRDTYPTFASFAPILLERIATLKPPASVWGRIWPVLIAVGSFFLFRYLRRERGEH